MMNHTLKLCAAMALVTFMPIAAFASCDLSIQTSGDTRVRNYNALSRQPSFEPIRIKLHNNGQQDCIGQLSFNRLDGDGELRGPQGLALDYLIVDERDFNRVLFEPNSSQRSSIPIQIRPDKSKEIEAEFVVRRGQAGISGLYKARLEAIFRENQELEILKRATVTLSAGVTPTVQANFVGVSNSGNQNGTSLLALGEIEPDMRRSLGLQLRSNTDVDIEVSSSNRGKLMSGERAATAAIIYRMSVGGRNVDLGTKGDIVLPASVNPRGKTSRIDIHVENFTDKPAGNYGDTILFRITAR